MNNKESLTPPIADQLIDRLVELTEQQKIKWHLLEDGGHCRQYLARWKDYDFRADWTETIFKIYLGQFPVAGITNYDRAETLRFVIVQSRTEPLLSSGQVLRIIKILLDSKA